MATSQYNAGHCERQHICPTSKFPDQLQHTFLHQHELKFSSSVPRGLRRSPYSSESKNVPQLLMSRHLFPLGAVWRPASMATSQYDAGHCERQHICPTSKSPDQLQHTFLHQHELKFSSSVPRELRRSLRVKKRPPAAHVPPSISSWRCMEASIHGYKPVRCRPL